VYPFTARTVVHSLSSYTDVKEARSRVVNAPVHSKKSCSQLELLDVDEGG